MARTTIIRKTLYLTEAQAADLDRLIAAFEAGISKSLGLDIQVGQSDFIRALLKQHAAETGQKWTDNYPPPGGSRK